MKKKIFRIFICFLVVCCLLVRISPIQAKAATLTGTVAAGTAIAAGLVVLGISVGATETAFNNLVDSLTAVAGSDRVPVWISETADGFVTYLQESFLGSLLSHCFDSGVLSYGFPYPSEWSNPSAFDAALSLCREFSTCVCWVRLDGFYQFVGTDTTTGFSITPSSSGGYSIRQANGFSFSRWAVGPDTLNVSGSTSSGSLSIPGSYYVFKDSSWDSIVSSQDLTLGSVGATMSAPNYDPWRSNAIPVAPPVVGGGTADEEDALPVTFPGLDTPSITGQTQAGAQSGITPGTVVEDILSGGEVVPETGTIADVITAVRALGVDMVSAIQALPAAIADVFTSSQTIEAYSLDLKSLFPFCIPFDIYSMLSALAAEPVAPKFDFELDFGPVGVIPISADFSEWDNVAQLLRTCEAAIFAVGLAVKTKELIGW